MIEIGFPSQPLGALQPDPPQSRSDSLWLHLMCLLLGGLAILLLANLTCRCRCAGTLMPCKSNCKNLATALEMYASDNQGQYPPRLEPYLIQGNYLKVIPTCPAVGRMTFGDYQTHRRYNRFQFSCQGNNHAAAYSGLGKPCEGFPAYNSENGLLDP